MSAPRSLSANLKPPARTSQRGASGPSGDVSVDAESAAHLSVLPAASSPWPFGRCAATPLSAAAALRAAIPDNVDRPSVFLSDLEPLSALDPSDDPFRRVTPETLEDFLATLLHQTFHETDPALPPPAPPVPTALLNALPHLALPEMVLRTHDALFLASIERKPARNAAPIHDLLRRRVCGERIGSETMHRSRLLGLTQHGEVYQTSGDVNEIIVADRKAYIASSARPTPTENRAGNLIDIDLHTLRSAVYDVHASSVRGAQYYQTVTDLAIFENRIVTAGFDKKVLVTEDNHVLYSYAGHQSLVSLLAQHPVRRELIVSAADSGSLVVHNVSRLSSQTLFDTPASPITHLAFSPLHPEHLYVSSDLRPGRRSGLMVWDVHSRQRVRIPARYGMVTGCLDIGHDISTFAFAPHTPWVALATYSAADDSGGDQRLHLVDTQSFQVTHELTTGHSDANVVGFSPCGTFLYSCGTNNSIVVYDTRRLDHVLSWLHHEPPKVASEVHDGVYDATWLPRSSLLATGGADGCLRFWDLHALAVERTEQRYLGLYTAEEFTDRDDFHVVDLNRGPICKLRFTDDEQSVVVACGSSVVVYKTLPAPA